MKIKLSFTNLIVFVVLFCTYIFPLGKLDPTYVLSKMIFISAISLYFVFNLKKFSVAEILFDLYIVVLAITLQNINYLMFISIPLLSKLLNKRNSIVSYLKNSNILYLCLVCTLGYSLIYFGDGGRYAFSAIKEANQSGLAIYCLGIMLLCKNKKVGIFTLMFGLLTFSRSYVLSLLLLLFMQTKLYKKIVTSKTIKMTSYSKLTVITSILFVLLALYYINQYKLGNIYYSSELYTKFFDFLDYSNLFRFLAILKVILIYYQSPIKLLTGITDAEYVKYGSSISYSLGVPSSGIVPHNLFFSHLKIYGLISIIETIYISFILKTIVNKNNYGVYIAIALYSLILGAGLYSYWLYLSVFALVLLSDFKQEVV